MPMTATVNNDAMREFLESLPLSTIATVSVMAWTPTSQYIPWSQSALVMKETSLEKGRLELTLESGERLCLLLEHIWFAYHDRRNNHLIVHLR